MSYKECPHCKQPLFFTGDTVFCRNGDFEKILSAQAQDDRQLTERTYETEDNGDYLDRKYSR